MMKLWLLERLDHDYDEVVSCVVRAETEQSARALAAEPDPRWPSNLHHRDGRHEFALTDYSTCVEIDMSGQPTVIHSHVHAG